MSQMYYHDFCFADIVRLRFVSVSSYNANEDVGVYKVVGHRYISTGSIIKKNYDYYVLQRLDKPYVALDIYEKNEILSRIVSQKFSGEVIQKIKTSLFEITINAFATNISSKEQQCIGTIQYLPTEDVFILICEEIYAEKYHLIKSYKDGYFPTFHDNIRERVEELRKGNIYWHYPYWRYSRESKERILELIEGFKVRYEYGEEE